MKFQGRSQGRGGRRELSVVLDRQMRVTPPRFRAMGEAGPEASGQSRVRHLSPEQEESSMAGPREARRRREGVECLWGLGARRTQRRLHDRVRRIRTLPPPSRGSCHHGRAPSSERAPGRHRRRRARRMLSRDRRTTLRCRSTEAVIRGDANTSPSAGPAIMVPCAIVPEANAITSPNTPPAFAPSAAPRAPLQARTRVSRPPLSTEPATIAHMIGVSATPLGDLRGRSYGVWWN